MWRSGASNLQPLMDLLVGKLLWERGGHLHIVPMWYGCLAVYLDKERERERERESSLC